MKNNLIMFSSATLAMKSRNILNRYNIYSRIIRTPMHLNNKSCGYSLLINNNTDKALKIIGNSGIEILGIASVDKL